MASFPKDVDIGRYANESPSDYYSVCKMCFRTKWQDYAEHLAVQPETLDLEPICSLRPSDLTKLHLDQLALPASACRL